MSLKERWQSASIMRKILIIVAILLLLLILGVLIYVLLMKYRQPASPIVTNENININTNTAGLANLNVQISSTYLAPESLTTEKEIQQKEKTALLVASSFAERYGSFSNQSDFANLNDLKLFMTESMKTYIDGVIAKSRAENASADEYYGVETKVISSDVQKLDDTLGQAEIMFTSQRSEYKGTANPRVYYQDILIKLEKVNDQWLVNGAYWQ